MKNTAILLISCPDQKGIVASVANFLYQHNANILHADEHQDSETKLFFLRTEWELDDFSLSKDDFRKKFSIIANRFQMTWRVAYSGQKPKIAVMVSRQDHCLADLLYRHKNNEFHGEIKCIISNHPDAEDLVRFYGIKFIEIPVDKTDKIPSEHKILTVLKKYNIDLAVLARYMQILSAQFLDSFGKPIINIHHSFLPAFIGGKPYQMAYERGVKIIGATAHYVTPHLDQGPIIEQDILRVSHRDNIENMIRKGKDIEKIVLSRAVKAHLENRILTYANKTVIFD